jgi:two-component sensor histidine kinase
MIFNLDRNATLEARVFTAVSGCASLAALAFLAVSLRLRYSVPIAGLSAVSALVYGLFFVWGRRSRSAKRVFFPFVVYTLVVVAGLWFGTGGFYSDVPVFFMATVVLFVTIAPDVFAQRVALAAAGALFVAFVIVQYAAPRLVFNVPTQSALTTANITSTAILATVVAVVTLAFKRSHDRDRREVRDLMSELTHRVTNNLSLVSSMILMKDHELGECADLSDLHARVNAVATMHDRMQHTDGVSQVRLGTYLGEILTAAFAQSSERTVSVVNQVPEVLISSRSAVILGLIVNEIAINATKYGFEGAESDEFRISLDETAGGDYVLITHETGPPFPDDIDFATAETTGLQLIRTLSEQIGGSAALGKQPHPSFRITFPRDGVR